MKRFTLLLLTLFITLFTSTGIITYPARAEGGRYAQAIVRDAYFYEDKNGASVFAVPYTYCIEVLGEDGDWYRARYAANTGVYREKIGYCYKKDFALLQTPPSATYLYKTVTVTYSADGVAGALPVLNQLAMEAAYYGAYQAGGDYYSYVYCQGSFGYISGANDDYPLNELPQEDGGEEASAADDGKEEGKSIWSAGLISVIIILALFVGVILMLHFTSKKSIKKD